MRTFTVLLLSFVLVGLAVPACADWIDSIAVVPPTPSEADSIRIIVSGTFGCLNTELVEDSFSIEGQTISIEVVSQQPLLCLPALAPWQVTEEIGPLSAGHYSVVAILRDAWGVTHDSKSSSFYVGEILYSRGCLRSGPGICQSALCYYLDPDPGYEEYVIGCDMFNPDPFCILNLLGREGYHVEVTGHPGWCSVECGALIIDDLVVLNPPVTLSVQDTNGLSGDTVLIDISLDNPQSIEELQFRLFDDSPGWLTAIDVLTTHRTAGFTVEYYQDTLGAVSVSIFSLIDSVIAPGEGPILQILYTVSLYAELCDSASIEALDAMIVDEKGESRCLTTQSGRFLSWYCSTITKGDLNLDCVLDIRDAVFLVNYILESEEPLLYPWCVLDCNGDGKVDVQDVVWIVNCILGIHCPPTGAMKITPAVVEYLQSLEPYFSAEDFARFMALVKAETGVPVEYTLSQNYPNPFNPATTIRYALPDARQTHASLKIYNILGQEVRTLVDEVKDPGFYEVTWDGKDAFGNNVASGVYFYRLTAADFSQAKRMVLMK
ncbi:MAG: FlgD immunoglobulin-like domain containing protein [bacterium]